MAYLTPPFPWYGGKVNMAKQLLALMPAHHTYVEAFGGAAALLLAKPRSPVEVYNDIDGDLVNFWRVVRDREKMEQLKFQLELTPYSRQEFVDARGALADGDVVTRAWRFFIKCRMAFGAEGSGTGWRFNRASNKDVNSWLASIPKLPAIHARLQTVQVDCLPAVRIIKNYDTPQTLFYLDPPYEHSTRTGGHGYRFEMTRACHQELVAALESAQGG